MPPEDMADLAHNLFIGSSDYLVQHVLLNQPKPGAAKFFEVSAGMIIDDFLDPDRAVNRPIESIMDAIGLLMAIPTGGLSLTPLLILRRASTMKKVLDSARKN